MRRWRTTLLVVGASLVALNGGLGVYRVTQGENAIGPFLSAAGVLVVVIAAVLARRSEGQDEATRPRRAGD